MAFFTYPYTLTNGTAADADQVQGNFNAVKNGVTDASTDVSISALTVAAAAAFNGAVTLGNGTNDDITVTGSLASSIPIKTTNSYDIGSATLGLRAAYFGQSGGANTAKLQAPTLSSDVTHTLPSVTGTLALDGATAGLVYNLGLANATTTNANDSIKIQGAAAALSSTNPLSVSINDDDAVGRSQRLTATADVTINLTGAHWGRGTFGDFTDIALAVYAINDNDTLKWGVSAKPNLRTITAAASSATATDINLYSEMLVTSTLTSTSHCVMVGWFLADFDDTGGAAEDLWAVQVAAGEINVGVDFPAPSGESVYNTGAGWGSTNTKIRRVETLETATSKAVAHATSAANGSSWTALEDGAFEINYVDANGTATEVLGISVNSNQLTTAIDAITAAHRKAYAACAVGQAISITRTARLTAGDVIRPHGNGASAVAGAVTRFSVAKVAHA